ncbi:type II toxin-antitoxin system PemI/MazE family antitoxin [Streptococcus himalayensis]|uniref:AbrB family transcriptional regulator n=1 Tax=Streptococcus himalayensis TaxID=1888195 RepID=A0A917EE32_9STRE|nr:hypothetical protein [Streptococcus himalayensis]QBX16539.1 hypothetical protein Javan255_0024 [Streptococcus phage Javan255]GGE26958.1 hypothetical protein GCM10011510_05200 [Streptococcus himalayensis]
MTVVKTRQVGNSISLTIPKELGIEIGQEYTVYKASDGSLLFSPSNELLLEKATDDLIREKLISELGAKIDKNLADIQAGNYMTLDKIEESLLG